MPATSPVPFSPVPCHDFASVFRAWGEDAETQNLPDAPALRVVLDNGVWAVMQRYEWGNNEGGVVAKVSHCGRVLAIGCNTDRELRRFWREELEWYESHAAKRRAAELAGTAGA